jgi:capsular polysaccharide biosynthesis protein
MDTLENKQHRRKQNSETINTYSEPMDEVETEIDLIELFYHLLDNIKYIIIASALCGVLAGIYSFVFLSPIYQATAKLYVTNSSNDALNLSDLQIGTYLTNDYQEVFKAWEVHETVIKNLGLNYTYSQLSEMLSIKNPSNTRILDITISSKNPIEAASIANEYAKVAKNYITETMAADEPNILSTALQPIKPVSPNKTLNTLIGILLGAFGTIAFFTVRFITDDKIKTSDDVTKYTNLPTLAIVPVLHEAIEDKKSYKKM